MTFEESTPEHYSKIETVISYHRPDVPSYSNQPIKYPKRNLITVKRSNKVLEASTLPVVVNLNPRSLYNKQEEFCTLIEQTEASVCCISESWDRSHVTGGSLISDRIQMDGYRWVKNIVQRKRKGGKPAIFLKEKDYHIKELCPEVITVPINVEVVWVLLTPKKLNVHSKVKNIAVASVYYSSTQTRKSEFLDHIAQAYSTLCSKYGPDLKFIIAGDVNKLNIKPILNLSPDLKQVVEVITRRNPDAILDVIITNLHNLFQPPRTLEPIDNDTDNSGKPSDHLVVVMEPLTNENPTRTKRYRTIKHRPFPDSAIREMGQWVQSQTWQEIFLQEDVNLKAQKFEEIIMEKVNLFCPEETLKLSENDKPWVDPKLIQLDRQQKREYNKRKRSKKWLKLNQLFQERAEQLKESYYTNMVEDLKISNPGQWYSKLKRMAAIDPAQDDKVCVQQIMDLPSDQQAERIADDFSKISNLYQPLKSEDIQIPSMINSKPYPLFEPHEVYEKIRKIKKKASTVLGDIPWKIVTEFSVELSTPLSNIYNSATLAGIWPTIWKFEYVTPVPKVYPPANTDELRKISGTKNLSKIYEALLSDGIVEDMSPNIDPSQFGNERGLSIQHYLVKMVNQILTILDSNNEQEKYAVVLQLVDWSKAFDRQDSRLGIESFIRNGVRPTLIPLLISYFQERKMQVKWHGLTSTIRDLPGGGPQGCTFGLLEYKSNTNNSADHVPVNMRFKFVDDLSMLEKLNLILCGLSSYNFHNHVASDIGIHQKYLPTENFQSQSYLAKIENWTTENKMKLNVKKSKIMLFNFTEDYQFSTRLYMENNLLDIITSTKLLGTIISSDLKWFENTEMIVKKAYQRMLILHRLYSFNIEDCDMINIYVLYIRSILEQSCQVWHHTISEDEVTDIERVQKVACKIILKNRYISYPQALETLNLETLRDRRNSLCLKFAKKCLKHEKARHLFPLNISDDKNTRDREMYNVQHARTSRLKDSALPQMQRMLNADVRK